MLAESSMDAYISVTLPIALSNVCTGRCNLLASHLNSIEFTHLSCISSKLIRPLLFRLSCTDLSAEQAI